MQRQRPNSGILFKNDRKETEAQPDYTGSLNVAGAEFLLSAWIKQGPKAKFMSLSVKAKADTAKANAAPASDFHSDEVPF